MPRARGAITHPGRMPTSVAGWWCGYLANFLFRGAHGRLDRMSCPTLEEPGPREEDESRRLGPEDRAARPRRDDRPDHAQDDREPAHQVDHIAPLLVGRRQLAR